MANFITYRNQGATRNLPLDEDLIKRLGYLQDMGLTMEVFSGGQPGKDEGGPRTGSVRHDHGGAADAFFYKDGRKLDWANPDDRPIFEQIVSQGKANGITGFGAGPGYMQEGSMHIGMGSPGVWGAGGKGANAPDWLKAAYNGSKFDPVAEVVAAANPTVTPTIGTPSAGTSAVIASAQQDKTVANPNAGKPYGDGLIAWGQNHFGNGAPVQPATVAANADGKPDADRGLLEKLGMGSMPDKVLGVDTNKGLKAFGSLASLMSADTAAQNQQVQAAARSGQARRAANDQVEIKPMGSVAMQSGGGIGGMTGDATDEEKKKQMLLALLGLGGGGGLLG